MDWRQNCKGQPCRKLNELLHYIKIKMFSFFFLMRKYLNFIQSNFINNREKPSFVYKNLEHKPTAPQWGSGRTIKGFSSIVYHQSPHSFFWVLVTSRNKWVTVYGNSYHVSRSSPSVVLNCLKQTHPDMSYPDKRVWDWQGSRWTGGYFLQTVQML